MTSAKNGNGFSCDPAGAEATISCPCCGGTLTPQMIDQILAAARRPREEATPVTALGAGTMIIDPHAHMTSRTTDDYEAMAAPASSPSSSRRSGSASRAPIVGTFVDYFDSSSAGSASAPASSASATTAPSASTRRRRTTRRWPSGDRVLPRFAAKEGVVAIGEIGYDEQTAPRTSTCARSSSSRRSTSCRSWSTRRTATRSAARCARWTCSPSTASTRRRCVIDHNNEETVQDVLDARLLGGVLDLPAHQDGQRAHDRDRAPATAPSGSSSTRPATGACPTRSRCRRPRADGRSAASSGGDPRSHLRQCARGLRPQRRDAEEHWLDRRRSTSARSSRATPCCAAGRRR